MKRYWTKDEDAVLRANYPDGGAEACRRLLNGRTRGAIHSRAKKLGLRQIDPPLSEPENYHAYMRAQDRRFIAAMKAAYQ